MGGIEIANFAKHEFKGPGAREYLNRVLADYVPKVGRVTLTPMLTPKGRLCGDLTVACLDDGHFMLFGSACRCPPWVQRRKPRTSMAHTSIDGSPSMIHSAIDRPTPPP